MKRLLSITLLIIAVLLGSCKEESEVSRIEKGTTKKVNALSYTFNSTQNEDSGTVKSGNSTDSTKVVSPIERKVLSVETLELGGETFVASLIEENDPIATKAPTQKVDGSSVYTFYAYKGSKIKSQIPISGGNTIDVPVDEATKYGMIFLSSAMGMENPKQLIPTKIDESIKEITYNAKFNENVCYASFDKEKMPPGNSIDVTFKPVFSQLGISVPSEIEGTTITVNKVELVSGGQENATVKVVYNSKATNNIDVSYDNTLADYPVVLDHNLNSTDKITYLYPNGKEGYYNIIPNKNPAKVSIEIAAKGIVTGTTTKTIEFKDAATNKPISFTCGKRYTIKITNIAPASIVIEPNPLNILPGQKGTLTATKVIMSDGSERRIPTPTGFTWEINSPNGVVTSTNGVVVSSSPQILTGNSSTTNKLSLTADTKYYGSAKVTVSYRGLSTKVDVNVYRDIPATAYYMWDAPVDQPYLTTNDGVDYNFNPITSGVASKSCKDAPTLDQIKRYLGAGVYWIEDGPPYKSPSPTGFVYRYGLLLMKYAKIPTGTVPSATALAYTKKDFSTDETINKSDYFFLPACGRYLGGDFFGVANFILYWSSTPDATDYFRAYYLYSTPSYGYNLIQVSANGRVLGLLPMPKL